MYTFDNYVYTAFSTFWSFLFHLWQKQLYLSEHSISHQNENLSAEKTQYFFNLEEICWQSINEWNEVRSGIKKSRWWSSFLQFLNLFSLNGQKLILAWPLSPCKFCWLLSSALYEKVCCPLWIVTTNGKQFLWVTVSW